MEGGQCCKCESTPMDRATLCFGKSCIPRKASFCAGLRRFWRCLGVNFHFRPSNPRFPILQTIIIRPLYTLVHL